MTGLVGLLRRVTRLEYYNIIKISFCLQLLGFGIFYLREGVVHVVEAWLIIFFSVVMASLSLHTIYLEEKKFGKVKDRGELKNED